MVFSSLVFLFRFLPIFLLIYFLTPKKLKNLTLFIASLIFYSWGEPVYVILMIFSTLVDYTHGILINKFHKEGKNKFALFVLISSILINLGLLSFFKYSNFFITTINSIFHSTIPILKLTLPIGISFYTFQTMSYTIDVYRKVINPQKNIIAFGAYVSLFPQLIAGPIVKYSTIASELTNRKENFSNFSYGIKRFIIGLGKKVLLANNIGFLWSEILSTNIENIPLLTAWIGIISYTFQIYFDFSGYSDMAIGLGRMLGFTFDENFNYPYISKSITEFWRRWHISLSSWFKEYVYIPLGGNRKGLLIQLKNILIVWTLTGFWHGAGWNFIIWGLYFAIILIIEKILLNKILQKLPNIISHIYTLIIIIFGWLIFYFEDVNSIIEYTKSLVGIHNIFDTNSLYLLINNLPFIIILTIASTPIAKNIYSKIFTKNNIFTTLVENIGLVSIFIISVSYLVNSNYNPFLYFRF